ncbi:MAG: Bax inhibitor-1/YccA family protein [Pseudomonadota bacterium]
MQSELRMAARSTLTLSQNRVLRNTYMMLGLTMIPTVIGAVMGVGTNFSFLAQSPIMGPLLMFAAMMGIMFGVQALRNSVWGVALLLAFTFIMGWWLGPMLQYALHFQNGSQLIGVAAGSTGVIFLTLAGIATVTKKDFSFLGKFLFIGLILLVLASLANLFFQIPALSLTLSAIGVLIFSAYILYDVSAIVQGGETNYVMATLRIYLDLYNLFVSLLQLLMAFSGNSRD